MPYLFIVVAIFVSLALFTGSISIYAKTNTKNSPKITENKISALSKTAIQQKLADLSKKPAPTELKMGAMCYDMAGPPERVEYTCPIDNTKTLYTQNTDTVSWDIPAARRLIKTINNPAFTLDESEFCKKCNPNITAPKLNLIVKYAGQKPYTMENISPNDLKLINEFLSGQDKHKTSNDAELPLKDYSDRLKVLLDVK
ncbi:MAG: hypothetical protein V1843_02830 [bacterium]